MINRRVKITIPVLVLSLMLSACNGSTSEESSTSGVDGNISDTEISTETTEETVVATESVYSDETAVSVSYEPVEYDDFEGDINSVNYRNVIEVALMDPDNLLVDMDGAIYDQSVVYPLVELENGLFYFGLEDPILLDYLLGLYANANESDYSSSDYTIDSLDYLNHWQTDWDYDRLEDIWGSSWYSTISEIMGYAGGDNKMSFDATTLDSIATQDHRLTRAIMVSLGRSYYIQEIPYSFFDFAFLDDTPSIYDDDWFIYNVASVLSDNYQTTLLDSLDLSYIIGWSNNTDGSLSTLEPCYSTLREEMSRQFGSDFPFLTYLQNDDYYVYLPWMQFVKAQCLDNHWTAFCVPFYCPGLLRNGFMDVSEECINEVFVNDYLVDYWPTSFTFTSDDMLGAILPDFLSDLESALPTDSLACFTCMRYNSQFYASALKVPTPNRLYRDDSNGAITMELSENKMQDVVDAFERAGTPLQTDENGNIIPETPAHFREVYGMDYTDVLAEYGLL